VFRATTDAPDSCVVLCPDDQREAAGRFAHAIGLPCRVIETRRFPDGETLLRLPTPLPERVIVFCTLNHPNTRLIELLLTVRTARRHDVRHLTLVAPYLCYMRQDMEFRPGEAVSQTIVGRFLSELFDAVVTVDPHLHRIDRLEQAIPAAQSVTLHATEPITRFLAEHAPDAVLIGPDEESEQWVAALARHSGMPHAVFVKTRRGDRDVEVLSRGIASLHGRRVVIFDDIASSGRTLIEAARSCRALGAVRADAMVTHALCSAQDHAQLLAGGLTEFWSTDSLPHVSNRVALADLLAQGCARAGLLQPPRQATR
jgi:ribose-phosphate pyrophosphokinase